MALVLNCDDMGLFLHWMVPPLWEARHRGISVAKTLLDPFPEQPKSRTALGRRMRHTFSGELDPPAPWEARYRANSVAKTHLDPFPEQPKPRTASGRKIPHTFSGELDTPPWEAP